MDATMKAYMDEAEQRLRRLEDAMANDPAKPKETDKKENDEINEFIEFLKKTNATPELEPGNDEDEFISFMKNMNQ